MTIIKDIRIDAGLTQQECADACKPPCSQSQWSVWEDHGPRTLRTLWRMCNALGVDSGEVQESLKGEMA